MKTKNKKIKKVKKTDKIKFPARILNPVKHFLELRLASLQKRKNDIEKDDPFKDTSRILDNASPDADAAEQFGHARASALEQQLDRAIIQTKKALTRIKIGKYGICEECGKMIDTDRLMVYPDATLCAKDAASKEK